MSNQKRLDALEKPQQPRLVVTVIPVPVASKKASSPSPFPTAAEAVAEARSLLSLSFPIGLTALLFYSRSAVSMLILGSLGELPLAAGSLAIAFANITAYSVLSGLSLGMDPLCSQAFGANQPKLLSLTLHRCVLFLLCSSLPISFLWLHMSRILLFLGQDPEITTLAQTYLHFILPDLLTLSFTHPIRIYLRSQSITRPLTLAAAFAAALHLPANLLLVTHLRLGVSGVAAASALSNLALLLFLVSYVHATGAHEPTWQSPTRECLLGWAPLVRLAGPSCLSVCLEWWWYELMILLCGLLPDPKPAVASMGVLIQTTSLLYIAPSSLGLAVSTRVGNELGANEPRRARVSAWVAMVLAGVTGVASMAVAVGVRGRWGRLFSGDGEIVRLTRAALPIVGVCELGNCPQTVGGGVLRGSARARDAAGVNVGGFYAVGVPVAVGLGFGVEMGLCGLWLGLVAAQACCAGLVVYVVGRTDWDAQARRASRLAMPGGEETGSGGEQPLISIKVGGEKRNDIIIEFDK